MTETNTNSGWMRDAFLDVQQELELKLRSDGRAIAHAPTHGAVSEEHWQGVLRAYLPNRYQVQSGIVIDSHGSRSHQIDIVIFDRHFTPTLLDRKSHRYIPVEAVYAVLEAKPELNKSTLQYAADKAASVRALHRTSIPIPHAGGVFPPKELFPILAGVVALRCGWSDGLGTSFHGCSPEEPERRLDCGCVLEAGAFDLVDGRPELAPREGALLNFLFRLLSKLQALGSVPAIDWNAYGAVLGELDDETGNQDG